ncbi:MAG TPA: glycosyltransferase [Fibrobacteria bacterium]|nr:glycosyltransferase [Fibrobacteria bacterium]
MTTHVREIGNGIVNAAVDLACSQAQAGHQVHYGSAGGEYERLLANFGAIHHRLTIPGFSIWTPLACWQFFRLLCKIKPDIVHVHMLGWALMARLFRPFYSYSSVATVHYLHKRFSRIMGGCDAVVALGRASRDAILAWGIPAHRVHMVVNAPLDSPRRTPLDAVVAAPLDSPSIVSVGGMYFHKGFSYLIEAFEKILSMHPTASLHLVGDGPDRAALQEQAAKVSADRIHFHGFQADPRPFMKSADVFVLASFKETFPLVLLECRDFRTRIVATDVDGNREALDDGDAGWLVEPRNSQALCDGILHALESNVPDAVSEGLDKYRGPALVAEMDRIYKEIRAVPASRGA